MRLSANKETSIKVIGWSFISLATLMVLTGVIGLITFLVTVRFSGEITIPTPGRFPEPLRLLIMMFRYFHYFAVLQTIFGGVLFIAGRHFLKLRAWARTFLEIAAWLSLFWVIGMTILWESSWIGIACRTPLLPLPSISLNIFVIFGAIAGVFFMVAWSSLLMALIWFLRSERIRGSMR